MDDQKSWENYRKLCLNAGNALLDEDKQAHDEMLMGLKPDTVLLKARLLCDGSLADRAYELLAPKMKSYSLNPKWRLEAVYRMGRICQLKNLSAEALHYFQDAWDFDLTHSDPMSCNAVLQSGLIYESLGDYQQAEDKYREVLQLKPRQYSRSLHQKAKAGLSRIQK
jgi:tetratricopeptide (TPR) repeat protein